MNAENICLNKKCASCLQTFHDVPELGLVGGCCSVLILTLWLRHLLLALPEDLEPMETPVGDRAVGCSFGAL